MLAQLRPTRSHIVGIQKNKFEFHLVCDLRKHKDSQQFVCNMQKERMHEQDVKSKLKIKQVMFRIWFLLILKYV